MVTGAGAAAQDVDFSLDVGAPSKEDVVSEHARRPERSLPRIVQDLHSKVKGGKAEGVAPLHPATAAVMDFQGAWPMLVDRASASVKRLFGMRDQVLGDMRANVEGSVVCAVSDPLAQDCPLVFLSRGFEDMTGYSSNVGLGRNCRFLQPSPAKLNKRINGEELERMKTFCTQEIRVGMQRSIINLLLNQRKTGERFWNLLHMQYVDLNGRPYILGIQTILKLPMPVVIRSVEDSDCFLASDETAFSNFIDDMGTFLMQLRVQLHADPSGNMKDAQEKTMVGLLAFMKKASSDYEGDHFVPLVGKDSVATFQNDVKWNAVFAEVSNSLFKVWQVSDRHEEVVACAVSDVNGEDCPLVYVSREFEVLTGYNRDWVLGRNCRFLQPKHSWLNHAFNNSERTKMFAFCKDPLARGSRCVNLLVNEHKSGYPFFNLLVMEHITVAVDPPRKANCAPRIKATRPYIFGVQTALDSNLLKLVETLALDQVGMLHLARLRSIFDSAVSSLGAQPLRTWSRGLIQGWAEGLPAFMVQPAMSLPLPGNAKAACCLPKFGLEVTYETVLEEVPKALEEGVRHFYLTYSIEDRGQGDFKYATLQNRLLALRLEELFARLKRRFLHYVRDGVTFTLVTPPLFVGCFDEVWKCMSNNGYSMTCWMLDMRGLETRHREKRIRETLQRMAAAQRSGRIQALGVCGAGKEAFLEVQRSATGPVISACVVETYPGKPDGDGSHARWLKQLRDQGITLIAANFFGPRECVLNCTAVTDAALRIQADPVALLAKWAEVQGFGVMLPKLRLWPSTERSGEALGRAPEHVPEHMLATACAFAEEPPAEVHRKFFRELQTVPSALDFFEELDLSSGPKAPALASAPEDGGSPQRRSAGAAAFPSAGGGGPGRQSEAPTSVRLPGAAPRLRAAGCPAGASGAGPAPGEAGRSASKARAESPQCPSESDSATSENFELLLAGCMMEPTTFPQELPLESLRTERASRGSSMRLELLESTISRLRPLAMHPAANFKPVSPSTMLPGIHLDGTVTRPASSRLPSRGLSSLQSMAATGKEETWASLADAPGGMGSEVSGGAASALATGVAAGGAPGGPSRAAPRRPLPRDFLRGASSASAEPRPGAHAARPPPLRTLDLAEPAFPRPVSTRSSPESIAAFLPAAAAGARAQKKGTQQQGDADRFSTALAASLVNASCSRKLASQGADHAEASSPASCKVRMAVRLAAKGLTVQEITEAMEVDRGAVESLLGAIC